MYAGVLSRVFTGVAGAGPEPVPPVPSRPSPSESVTDTDPSRFSRSELDRARGEASRLVKQSRYSQAADLLAAVVEPATRMFGTFDDDVASLRLELANVLFDGGDYRRAAPAYQRLAADLAARHGADAELVLKCRLKEATCHALVGQTSQALQQLGDLLHDERRIFGADDARITELRRQIGLLQLGAGQRKAAEETLSELVADLTRLHGPTHPAVNEVRELLAGLHR